MKRIYFYLALLFCYCSLNATVYVIHFGTHYGHNYLPDAMIINLGDTVEFSGPLALLPLQSTILPAGADSFSADTGNTYRYIPTVLGTHNYQCKADLAMIGSFYVQSNVAIEWLSQKPFSVIYIPENQELRIEHLADENYEVALYNENGVEIFCEKYLKIINLSPFGLEKAIYYLQIRKKDFIFTNKIFIY
ncbi:MAG: hypothetical protein WCP57_06605 [Bacteroidota bacterium]